MLGNINISMIFLVNEYVCVCFVSVKQCFGAVGFLGSTMSHLSITYPFLGYRFVDYFIDSVWSILGVSCSLEFTVFISKSVN